MISYEQGVFHLSTSSYSYLFRLLPTGQLEHLHFGPPVEREDWEVLACKPGLGWGASVPLSEEDKAPCLDVLPLEWSGSGRGDYRDSPLAISREGLPLATDFRYESHEILPGIAPMDLLPQARDGGETLVVSLVCRKLILRLYYTVFEDVLTRRAVLENAGDYPVTIHKFLSYCVDLPGKLNLTTFDGGWIAEMRQTTTPVGAARLVNESTTGFSSHRHNPGFLLSEEGAGESQGRVFGFNLVYSGNHYASAQRSLQGLTRVVQGISPDNFSYILPPGETFEAPEGVLGYSGDGFNGLSRRFHRFVNRHIIPSHWRNRPRPVLYNSWEGCSFDFDQRRLLTLAKSAKALGCELFVLDDGWFGTRDSDRSGLGDYNVNQKKLPQGLAGLSKQVHDIGMDFGLWFEPEAFNPDSRLYQAHPDWAFTDDLPPLMGRHELLLDLTKPEVQDYIVSSLGRILDSAHISYVKWDMNRHSTALGARAHDYILGLYQVLHRIFDPRPEILLEGCSSGGNRFDLGMLCFAPQIWASDNTDPIERMGIQNSLSYLYPQSTIGAHVSASPHAQTLRTTPLSTRGNVAFFGILGYELDLQHLLPVEEREIAAQIAYYKSHRRLFQFGTFRRLRAEEGLAWQVSGTRGHMVGLFHTLVPAAPGYEQLRPEGLNRRKRYRLTSRPQHLRVGEFGALVQHISPVRLNPNGLILRTADHRYPMMDGAWDCTASGAALLSGIRLSPRFSGTGYDASLRMQGDFGSNIYYLKEINEK